MSFSLQDILERAERGQLKLSAEAAGALTLASAEQLKQRPRQVAASDVLLEASGSLTINSSAPADTIDADLRLRCVLRDLLSCATSESPALKHVADAPARGVPQLCNELLGAMVPFNRGAARRGLTRLYRRIRELPKRAAQHSPLVERRSLPSTIERALSAEELAAPDSMAPNSTPTFSTPIFGSLPVEFADVPTDVHDTEIDVVSRELKFLDEAIASDGRSPLPRDVYDCSRPPPRTPVYHTRESVIIEDEDSVVARNPALPLGGTEPIFGAFSPRRSDVGALLGDFGVSGSGTVRETTRKLRDSVGVNSDFLTPLSPSVSSRTPPPVQFAPGRNLAEKSSSKLMLMASVFIASVALAWVFRPAAPAAVGVAPAQCSAQVQVRSEPASEVRLVSASQQLRRSGPSAFFAAVPCDEDAEVIVLLNSNEGALGRDQVGLGPHAAARTLGEGPRRDSLPAGRGAASAPHDELGRDQVGLGPHAAARTLGEGPRRPSLNSPQQSCSGTRSPGSLTPPAGRGAAPAPHNELAPLSLGTPPGAASQADTHTAGRASAEPARTPPRAGWLRVPLPKDRLRSAAKSGKPLVISVFGR